MGGRPWPVVPVGVGVGVGPRAGVDVDGSVGERSERRHLASVMTPSARTSESLRIPVLSCNAELRPFREVISAWTVATATCRLCDWADRACAADADWEVFERRVSETALETADWRACFSGLGGMGGGRALVGGWKVGRSTSKGDVRRSVGVVFVGCAGGAGGAGAVVGGWLGGCLGVGTGPGPGAGCDCGTGPGPGCDCGTAARAGPGCGF